jgi:DNA-binding MarR family transcriptional regulator
VSELRGPHASTGYWLKLSAQSYQRELDAALRALKLTTPQFSVLAGANWLAQKRPGPTQQRIADFAGADRMMTSKILKTLEARKLIRRSTDPSDARVRIIELTESGRALVTRAIALAREVDKKLFGSQTALRSLLIEHFGKDIGALG